MMQLPLKTICFIRHAKSSWDDISLADHDRPLNKRGKRDAPMMAEKMEKLGIKPDYILCSTARRAKDTARHFIKTFELKESDVRYEGNLYGAGPDDVIRIVRTVPDDKKSVFVFGHNPTLTILANTFAGVQIDNVPTCGVFKAKTMVESWKSFDPAQAAFVAFYYPKQYSK